MNNKKSLREEFRNAVFKRDKYVCAMCGHKPATIDQLDAHHIIDRTQMPFGGYCAANGISLCTDRCVNSDCHRKAEYLHATGIEFPGYTPDELYVKIKSSYRSAYADSLKIEIEANKANAMIDIIDEISDAESKICLRMYESTSQETWELTCDELNEFEPLIRAYGKGRCT